MIFIVVVLWFPHTNPKRCYKLSVLWLRNCRITVSPAFRYKTAPARLDLKVLREQESQCAKVSIKAVFHLSWELVFLQQTTIIWLNPTLCGQPGDLVCLTLQSEIKTLGQTADLTWGCAPGTVTVEAVRVGSLCPRTVSQKLCLLNFSVQVVSLDIHGHHVNCPCLK